MGFRVRGVVRSLNNALDFQVQFDREFGAGKYERHVVEDYEKGNFDDIFNGMFAVRLIIHGLRGCDLRIVFQGVPQWSTPHRLYMPPARPPQSYSPLW